MNDFTREELETLLCGLSHLNEVNPDGEVILKNKIQSLIDIHCEHQQTYYSNGVKLDCMDCKKQGRI